MHNIATTSKPPLNAIKIKVNKHHRKTLRQLKNMINTIYSNLVTISFAKKDNSHFFPIIILGIFLKQDFISLWVHSDVKKKYINIIDHVDKLRYQILFQIRIIYIKIKLEVI